MIRRDALGGVWCWNRILRAVARCKLKICIFRDMKSPFWLEGEPIWCIEDD